MYPNDPKVLDRQAFAYNVDPDQTGPTGAVEQSDQGLHCLPFQLLFLDKVSPWKDLFI